MLDVLSLGCQTGGGLGSRVKKCQVSLSEAMTSNTLEVYCFILIHMCSAVQQTETNGVYDTAKRRLLRPNMRIHDERILTYSLCTP